VDEDDFLIVIRPSDLATLRIVTVNGTAVPFKRDDPTKPWRLQLENDQIRNLGDGVEQILVVEEDHLPSDPAVPDSGLGVPAAEPFAARTVFAAVIEGPFLPTSQ